MAWYILELMGEEAGYMVTTLFPVSAVKNRFFVDIVGKSPRKWEFARIEKRLEKRLSSAFHLFVNLKFQDTHL